MAADTLGGVFDSAKPVELHISHEMAAALGLPDGELDGQLVTVRSVMIRDSGYLQVDHEVDGGKNRYLLPAGSVTFARQFLPDVPAFPEPSGG